MAHFSLNLVPAASSSVRARSARLLSVLGLSLALTGASQLAHADHHEGETHAGHAHAAKETAPAANAEGVVLYEAGVHYEELLVPSAPADTSTVEVVEMFSYACIHCFNFDAAVHEWSLRQNEGVTFTRIPAIFSQAWALLAQSYYTAEALGVSDKTHDALFEAIHTRKEDLRTPTAIAALFKRVADVEEGDFQKAFDSFSVRSKLQQADSRARQFRLQSVPTMVVNGKYKTSSTMAGTNIGMLQVVDFLVKKEQAAQSAEAQTVEKAAAKAAQK